MVKLMHYQACHREALSRFVLSEEQFQYTDYPLGSMESDMDGRTYVVILADEEPVGFFVLNQNSKREMFTATPPHTLADCFFGRRKAAGEGICLGRPQSA